MVRSVCTNLASRWRQVGPSLAPARLQPSAGWRPTPTPPLHMQTCIHTDIHTDIHTYLHTHMHAGAHPYIHAYILTCSQSCTHTYINPCTHTWARLRALPLGAGGESQRCWQMRGGEPHAEYAGLPHVLGPETAPLGLRATGQRHRFSRSTPSQLTQSALDTQLAPLGLHATGQRHRSSRSTPPQLAQSALATQLKMRRIQHGACTCSETVSDHIGGGCGLFVGRLGDAQTNTGLSQFLCTPALWVMSPTR